MQKLVAVIFELLLIAGGVLALSSLIVAKKPEAARILDKLMPFQALIGIAMMAMSIVFLLVTGPVALFKSIKTVPVMALTSLAGVISGILLGALFGMVQLAKGSSPQAQQRALELAQRVAVFQFLIGVIALGAGVLGLLYTTGIMQFAESKGIG
jgi:hypothetical protein